MAQKLAVTRPRFQQMKTLAHFASSIGVVALLAGCGGPQLPVGPFGATPQSRAITPGAERDGSWMLPEAKSQDLLYVSAGGFAFAELPKGARSSSK
jgi:hypothetical protein